MRSADFRCWHITSVGAVQRHVRSWGQTGSNRHTAKTTRPEVDMGKALAAPKFMSEVMRDRV
jgi:hypothetical protein